MKWTTTHQKSNAGPRQTNPNPPQGTQQDIGALHFDQQHHQSLLNFAAILN